MIHLLLARAGLLFAGHGLKIGLAVGLLAMVVTWDRGRIGRAEERGRSEVVQASREQGAQNAAKSDEAHNIARKPGALERLRSDRKTCPDCSR